MNPKKNAQNLVLPLIHTIRGQRAILDADLAKLYGVSTKQFNQAVKRNRGRFPPDFSFRLTVSESSAVCGHKL